jgi:N-acetyltransferase B complex (NatB) non catalytic subunit
MEALTLVDAGLKESPYNSQFFLVQLQLYSWIGAIIPATDAYNGLRPKHMQQDTLAHRIVPVLVHGGGHFIAKQFAEDTYRFHRNSIGDIADNTRTAFTRSSYSKVGWVFWCFCHEALAIFRFVHPCILAPDIRVQAV